MLPGANFGTATRVTGTGYTAITSANAYIIGILFASSGTCALSLYAGVGATGSSTIGGPIRFNVTVEATIPAAQFISYPAYCSGGFHINIPACADPNVTLFWNPAGGA